VTPEFDLIARYFTRPPSRAVLGIGDDCALIKVADGCVLAISTDTLVSGTHFFADADAGMLGHKALAVNLSDLAAMGATPRYVTLALTLPVVDHAWLSAFSRGFFQLADQHQVELIGGDTTRGPLSMTLTAFGEVESGRALRRDGATAGDDVGVRQSWRRGMALMHLQSRLTLKPGVLDRAAARLHNRSRARAGEALPTSAAIDVSDGLPLISSYCRTIHSAAIVNGCCCRLHRCCCRLVCREDGLQSVRWRRLRALFYAPPAARAALMPCPKTELP
jgi:thiamine-monophosphate kinase